MTTETKSSKAPGTVAHTALNAPRPNSKGRNGFFTARSIAVWQESSDSIRVMAYSRRVGHSAPLELVLSPEDACILAAALLAAAKGTLDPATREIIEHAAATV